MWESLRHASVSGSLFGELGLFCTCSRSLLTLDTLTRSSGMPVLVGLINSVVGLFCNCSRSLVTINIQICQYQ
jgi:hypothetical protein